MSDEAKQWIVQGDAVSSGKLAERIAADPEIRSIRHIARDMVVLAMPPDRAELLKRELDLLVEPDEFLEHFS